MKSFFQASYFIFETIALLGTGLNAFQVCHTVRNTRQWTPFKSSTFSLSIADLLTSSFNLAFMIYKHLWYNSLLQDNSDFNDAMQVMIQYSILSSIFHLLYIAFIRIFAVIWPIKFRLFITSRFSSISITIIWILSLVFSIINVFLFEVDLIGFIALSSQVLFVAIYTIICCMVRKQDEAASRLATGSQNRPPAFHHTLLHSVLVTSAFILCTLPAALFYAGFVNRDDQRYAFEWASWMFYLNPSFDSMLYFYFSRKHSKTHRILFNFRSLWNRDFYSLESTAKAYDIEMTKTMASQKFAFTNGQSEYIKTKSSDQK